MNNKYTYITAIAVALAFSAQAATTETYTFTAPIGQAIIIPAAKAGLVRVDIGCTTTINGTLVVNNQSSGAQGASVSLALAYSAPPFAMTQQFGAYKTWPLGVTSTSGFGFTDAKAAYYTSGLANWQNQSSFTVQASAVAGGTLPTGFSASGSVDSTSKTTLTVTYTYDSLPPAIKPKKKAGSR